MFFVAVVVVVVVGFAGVADVVLVSGHEILESLLLATPPRTATQGETNHT